MSEIGLNLRDIQWLDCWKEDGFEQLERAINYHFKSKISWRWKEKCVIVVLNKIKQHPFDVNRRALQQKYPIRKFIATDTQYLGSALIIVSELS